MPEAGPDPENAAEESEPADDTTLGGYFRIHDRPPAFEGSDGHPYTVSVEVEQTADLRAPSHGYLVFLRWAQTGVGIVGHVESPTLVRSRTPEAATEELGRLTLFDVQEQLEAAIAGGGSDAERRSGEEGRERGE